MQKPSAGRVVMTLGLLSMGVLEHPAMITHVYEDSDGVAEPLQTEFAVDLTIFPRGLQPKTRERVPFVADRSEAIMYRTGMAKAPNETQPDGFVPFVAFWPTMIGANPALPAATAAEILDSKVNGGKAPETGPIPPAAPAALDLQPPAEVVEVVEGNNKPTEV